MTTDRVSAAADLDALYGEPIVPHRRGPLEGSLQPHSREILNSGSAKRLKALMTVTNKGLGVTKFVYCELPILWATDINGGIWFAVEEVREKATGEFVFPRIRDTKIAKDHEKLGHPALLLNTDATARGRIGGEILYDRKKRNG